jgi:imidazolonepropionase-like amidohydrolase
MAGCNTAGQTGVIQMLKTALLFAGFLATAATAQAPAPAGASQPATASITAIKAGRLIADARTGSGSPALILVEGGRIKAVLPPDAPIPAGATLVDLSDATVLPGLIDSHVHLTSDPDTRFWEEAVDTSEYQSLVGAKNARLTVRAGFTTVRDLGSARLSAFALRDAINKGFVPGPRILAAGPAISIIGGHGDVSGFRPEVVQALSPGNTCTGPTECAERVREASRAGADVIKITATGGVLSQQARGLGLHFTTAEVKAIVDTANSLGLKIAAHAHGDDGIRGAAAAGVASIEHGTYASPETLKVMKANGTWMVPTLAALTGLSERIGTGAFTPPVIAKARQVLEVWGQQIQLSRQAGVNIAFGTDAGVIEHGRNAEEFALLVGKGGMTQRAALVSATTGAAELLGLLDQIGTITPGKSADIIAVSGDPLTDPASLLKMRFVMASGRMIPVD